MIPKNSVVITKTSIFLLYLHKVVLLNMLLEIFPQVRKWEDMLCLGAIVWPTRKPPLTRPLPVQLFLTPTLSLRVSYARLCAPVLLSTLNGNSVSYLSLWAMSWLRSETFVVFIFV